MSGQTKSKTSTLEKEKTLQKKTGTAQRQTNNIQIIQYVKQHYYRTKLSKSP